MIGKKLVAFTASFAALHFITSVFLRARYSTQRPSRTRFWSLTAIFAALSVVLFPLPAFKVFGVPGATISISAIVPSISGVVVGPCAGALAALIGGLIGCFIAPWGAVFGVLTFIPGTISAFCAGLIYRRKALLPLLILGAAIIAFLAFPYSREYPYFVWFDLIAWIALLSPLRRKAVEYLNKRDLSKMSIGMGIIAFIEMAVAHMAGCALAQAYFPIAMGFVIPATIWQGVTFVYPVERAILVTIAAIVGASIIKSLRALGFVPLGASSHG